MKEEEGCWWCDGQTKQMRDHLFGRCPRFKKEYEGLVKAAGKIRRKKKKKPKFTWRAVDFFSEEGYKGEVIKYLKKTGIGYRVEQVAQEDHG